MSDAQWTVTGLIFLIMGLEALRSQAIRDAFKGWWSNFNLSLNNAAKAGK